MEAEHQDDLGHRAVGMAEFVGGCVDAGVEDELLNRHGNWLVKQCSCFTGREIACIDFA